MRSNELRDDGASLTTFEDFAPMVLLFYGICVLATVQLSELEARVLVSDCCSGKRLTLSRPVDQLSAALDHVSGYTGCHCGLLAVQASASVDASSSFKRGADSGLYCALLAALGLRERNAASPHVYFILPSSAALGAVLLCTVRRRD